MMKGWKTWIAAGAMGLLGIIDIINGDVESGVQKLTGAIALVGIGHKIDRAGL